MPLPRVEDYTTIDVGGDCLRLRLLCEEPKPRLALECAMRRWLKYDAEWHHETENWTLGRALQEEAPAPWELSRNGYWTCRIHNAVQEAVETEGAVVGHFAELAAFSNESAPDGELALFDVESTCLGDITAKIRKRVEPTPDSPEWWVPLASCHIIVPFALELARLGYEDAEWRIWWGELHSTSTVLDMRHKRVFDLLLWDELEHPERPLELALRRWIAAGTGTKASAPGNKR